ncbi:odorant receptor 46a-like [Ostrinia nubilalis]|uniref:odorant receptor 46a-like n=1 Tax=Ostrinia nubilalis TaxID=29057 RepID=UPI00308268F6
MEGPSTYSTFRAFTPHFNALARVGYFKLITPISPTRLILHNCYRGFIWLLVLSYNLQQLIRIVQTRHSTDEMVDTLFIMLTTLNTLGKQVALNARVRRVDRILNVINGPIFAAKNVEHVELMKLNEKTMARLLYFFQGMAMTGCVMHATYPLINKALGQDEVASYFSSETNGSLTYELATWYLSMVLTIQAYGNITMDCTISGFYAMAKAQLQVLRYNLEHLVDIDEEMESKDSKMQERFAYQDSQAIQSRLVHCVRHHLQIKWFVKEVESIFCEAMTVQFLIMAFVICMTVYKIVGLSASSAEFWMVFVYLNCMLSQLFIYCYFGTQVKVESEFIAQSAYCSSWSRLSPAFRRQLVILMQCARPIVPCAAKIVPVSLETYIAVLRASYTLFTILDKQ